MKRPFNRHHKLLSFLLAILSCTIMQALRAADTTGVVYQLSALPCELVARTDKKINAARAGLLKQSKKYIRKFSKQEAGLRRKISRLDSSAGETIFSYDPSAQFVIQLRFAKIYFCIGLSPGKAISSLSRDDVTLPYFLCCLQEVVSGVAYSCPALLTSSLR